MIQNFEQFRISLKFENKRKSALISNLNKGLQVLSEC